MNIEEIIEILETDTVSATFSQKGLSFLSLVNDKGKETISLRETLKENDKDSREYILLKETKSFLETGTHNMKLDLSDFTEFQQSVFKAVSEIKVGEICSYKDVAEMIDNPGAAQAVGTAISKNPVSYFLPTHRVLPKKGIGRCKSGAGYLREKLLELEGHDIEKLKGNYTCSRNKCCME